MSLVNDVSGELTHGDAIDLPADGQPLARVTVSKADAQTDTVATLARSTPTMQGINNVTLTVTKFYEINELISNVHRVQVRPDLMQSKVALAGRAFIEQMNDDLRVQFQAAASAQQIAAIATSSFGNATHATAILKSLRDAAVKADELHWPRPGRFAVMSPAYYDLVADKILTEKYFFQSNINDQAGATSSVMQWKGWSIYMDDSMDAGKGNGATRHQIFYGRVNEGMAHASQIREMAVIRSEVYRGALVQGDVAWGNIINQPSKILLTVTTIS